MVRFAYSAGKDSQTNKDTSTKVTANKLTMFDAIKGMLDSHRHKRVIQTPKVNKFVNPNESEMNNFKDKLKTFIFNHEKLGELWTYL